MGLSKAVTRFKFDPHRHVNAWFMDMLAINQLGLASQASEQGVTDLS
jgi:hypothetical protein